MPALYIDLDVGKDDAPATREDALALLAELVPVPPTMLVNSGNGLHCYFVLAEPITDFDQMRLVERAWKCHVQGGAKTRGYKIDSAFDLARILRMPGTFNFKGEPKPVELLECHPERLYSVDDLLPDGWDNPDAEPKQTADPAPATRHSLAEDIATIVDVLPRIPDHHIDEYQTWLEIGMAIHSVLPDDAGLALWRERSMVSGNYEEGCCEEKWRTFEHKANGVGVGTLVYLAQEAEAENEKLNGGSGIRVASAKDVKPLQGPMLVTLSNPMATAREFIRCCFSHGGYRTLHFCGDRFLRWTGTHYAKIPTHEVLAQLWLFADKAKVRCKNDEGNWEYKGFNPTTKVITDIFNACKAVTTIPWDTKTPCWLEPQPDDPKPDQIVALGNCLFDIERRKTLAHSPRYFNLNAANFNYDNKATRPVKWMKFVRDIWPDDEQAVTAFQQWFGYCLTPCTKQQKIMLMVGPKRSGKSTAASVLTALVGEENVVDPSLDDLTDRFGPSTLIGKSLAILNEGRLSSGSRQSKIVEILLSISGEDRKTADRKNRDAWTGKLTTRFMLISNELPRLTDASAAIASRFVVLMLKNTFYDKENIDLYDELVEELPGIFNWAVDGWHSLKASGRFVTPESSADAVADLEDTSSPVAAFVRECCMVDPKCRYRTDDLYEAWCVWCENNGQHASSKQRFGLWLRAAYPGLDNHQRREGGERIREWIGIAVEEMPVSRSVTRDISTRNLRLNNN